MDYFDTSVLVPYYCPERLSIAAEHAILQSSDRTISKLSEVEFASALSLKIRTGIFDIATAGKAESQFKSHLAAGSYRFLSIQLREFELARHWISQFSTPLRTLDALHLATAHVNQCELITADKNLEKSAVILGVRCRLIS
jgi:predicted nucleic acid-binding protein